MIGFLSLLVNHLQIGMSQPEETDIAITPEELADGFREGIEWHAIYLREAKVGFSKLERRATPDGFVLKQMMRLNMTVMRQDQVLTVSVKTHLNRDYTLKSFDLRMDNPAAPFAAVGRVDGTLVNVALTMGSYTERKKIQLDESPDGGTGGPTLVDAKEPRRRATLRREILRPFESVGKGDEHRLPRNVENEQPG